MVLLTFLPIGHAQSKPIRCKMRSILPHGTRPDPHGTPPDPHGTPSSASYTPPTAPSHTSRYSGGCVGSLHPTRARASGVEALGRAARARNDPLRGPRAPRAAWHRNTHIEPKSAFTYVGLSQPTRGGHTQCCWTHPTYVKYVSLRATTGPLGAS